MTQFFMPIAIVGILIAIVGKVIHKRTVFITGLVVFVLAMMVLLCLSL